MRREERSANNPRPVRCAIYTRKSTEDGLEQEFNSLDAQREAGEAYITSQLSEGWICLPTEYDDGGFSGGNMERPALRRLMKDIENGKRVVVGVNKFQADAPPPKDLLKVNPAIREVQLARLAEVKRRRNAGRVSAALDALREGARDTEAAAGDAEGPRGDGDPECGDPCVQDSGDGAADAGMPRDDGDPA